jgi:outer membrane murein-binding lipoprotein Lpp
MIYKIRLWQLTLLLVLALCLGWLSPFFHHAAFADPRLESRVNRLESDLRRLSSQVNRIESQLSRPERSSPRPELAPPATPVELSREEQFENLATLAVETKLQVRELESRVARLEQVLTGEP